MSLAWMAGLALYFLGEKLAPRARQIGHLAGALLISAGLVILMMLLAG
jgi:predicted metal-binding membrane protein